MVLGGQLRPGRDGEGGDRGGAWPAARDGILAMLNEINERDDGTLAAAYGYLETIGHKPEA